MTELEFARAYLDDYRQRGDEIVAKLCPFCHGGQHGDKYTFSINTEKHVYKCQRGSCGAEGHFNQLLTKYGLPMEPSLLPQDTRPRAVHTPKVARHYVRPALCNVVAQGTEMDYIRSRGITPETAAAFGVGGNGKGEVVFPYYDNRTEYECRKPTFVKYRPAHKVEKGERKAWREKDAKPILFGMHLCAPEQGVLYLFEGEFDCMVAWQVHGGNCVSVPSGCQDFTWLETCADFLGQYDTVAVIGDNDAPGQEMIERLADKMDCRVLAPDFDSYVGCKDINELLFHHGAAQVQQAMDSVRLVPTLGLINAADIRATDPAQQPHILSGFAPLNQLTGGLYLGDLVVCSGRRGEGKSTLLTQEMLVAIDQGYNVCVYSGETTSERFKHTMYLQAAGTAHVRLYTDKETGRVHAFVPQDIMARIDRWLDGHYWLYDNRIAEADEADSILQVMEKAYKRYDCRVFLVDNLMTVRTGSKETDFYQKQAAFALALQKFSRAHQVLVYLVVHPRKTGGRAVTDNDEISGLSTITNIADTVLSVHRLNESARKANGCDGTLQVLKNRATGELGEVALLYRPNARRFMARHEHAEENAFGWEKMDNALDTQLEEPPF